MTRRGAVAALLLLTVVACSAPKDERPPAPATADVLYSQGRRAFESADYATAKAIARDGRKRFAAQRSWNELFAVLEAECVVRDDPPAALAILKQAPETDDPLPSIRRLTVLAATQKPAEANATYLKADELAARVLPSSRPEIAWRRIWPLFVLDNKREARIAAKQAIDGAAAYQQPWVLAGAYGTLAGIESTESRWDDAIKHYTVARRYAQQARSKALELAATANLGWCQLESGEFDGAIETLKPALQSAHAQQSNYYEHMSAVQLAEAYNRRLEINEALPYAEIGLNVAQRWKNSKALANSYHQLASFEVERRNYAAASAWNERAWAMRFEQDDCAGQNHQSFIDARILAKTGNPAEALRILKQLLASKYPPPDTAMRWRAQGIMGDTYEQLGLFDKAEEMYEKTLDTGAEARQGVRGSDSGLAFERNLFGFYDSYINVLLEQGRKADALMIAERSRARTLRETLGLESDENVDPRKLAREKNATILFYWLGPERSLLWTITPNDIAVAELPDDDEAIDGSADDYRRELLERSRSVENSVRGQTLYAKLVAPAKIPRGSRVIILPHSHLNALNFETLIVPTPKPYYWIEDVTISYSPSLHVLAKTPPWRGGIRGARALLLGDVRTAGVEYPPLKRARQELDSVAGHFDKSRCVILSGTAATPAAYVNATPKQFGFIHFAAHATASTSAPLDASVILAEPLTARRIARTPLNAELVTISSCYSAGSRSYAGEGLVGLAWAFLGAGAHRVVAAQWEVDDRIAPDIMNAMYEGIARGVEPAEALRAAKLQLLAANNMRRHPYYWAPFVLYGE